MATAPPRPPAVTLTCVLLAVGCGLLLVQLTSVLGSWGSIEMQDGLRTLADDARLRDLGIGLDQLLDLARWLVYAAIAFAACGAVFAVYTVRGHRTSRLMLTILCGVAAFAFATLGLGGILPAAFAAMCAFSLWSPDARRWFDAVDGRAARPPLSAPAAPVQPHVHPSEPVAPGPQQQAVASPAPLATYPGAVPPPVRTGGRPRAVTVPVVVTLVSSGVVALLGAVNLLVSTVGADLFREAMQQPGLGQDFMRMAGTDVEEMLTTARWTSAVWLVLGLAGLAAAAATARRSRAGVVALSGLCGLTVAGAIVFFPLGIVTAGLAIWVLVQLRHPDARAWFAAPKDRSDA